MEAAVLLLPEADSPGPGLGLSPELEVKKLQDLVRRLERQNEQLRTRSSAAGLCLLRQPSLGSLVDYLDPPGAAEEEEEEEEEEEPSVLDGLELLDLDRLDGADASDETWLYVAPRGRGAPRDPLPPLQWCRQVLDRPQSQVEAARQSLTLRLEQVSRWRSSLSGPSPSTCSSPGPPLSRVAPVPATPSSRPCSTPQASSRPCSTPQAERRHAPPLSSPLHLALQRTLSPIRKEPGPGAERTPTFFPHPLARSGGLRGSAPSPQWSADSDLGPSEAEDDSIALGYKLQDLTDVQVMARLQEENLRAHRYFSFINPRRCLRQDLASVSSVLGGRRSQSFTFQLSAGPGLEEEDEEEEEDDDEDYALPPPPRLTRLPHSHTFCSVREWRRGSSSPLSPPSTPCTPPGPSAGWPSPAEPPPPPPPPLAPPFRPGSDKLRRSMPNLLRAPSMPSGPLPSHPAASPSLLRNSQSFDSSGGLARLQSSIPSPGQLQQRVHSLGNFSSLSRPPPKATAYVSPTVKGSTLPPPPAGLQAPPPAGGAGSGIPLLSKPAGPLPSGTGPRSGLPRPASFVAATGSAPRGKAVQSARSLLTPPKSLSALGILRDSAWRDAALRDSAWQDGCY